MESNKSIYRFYVYKNLYKAFVDAYESDKLILDTYGDTVSFKRCRDDEDKAKNPLPLDQHRGQLQVTEGSKSHHKSADKSVQAEEPMHTAKDLEEPTHQEFVTGDTKDKPNEETSQLPDWFQKPAKPPTPDRDWNKTLLTAHGPVQPWLMPTLDQKRRYPLESQQYPPDLRKPLPLIPDSRGRQVIPFDHFINNDLAYESAHNVYSKRRIIAVTKLQIVKWHNYKHLHWTTIRRDDDKLYKFKEGDFNRLRIQDIEDMLLLLTVLDDRLKGIRMKYLPQAIWRQSDKDKAGAMIQAIDKHLKTRRIMRSLEKFIGGRPHRYSNLMIQPEPEGSTQGYLLNSVEVLRLSWTQWRYAQPSLVTQDLSMDSCFISHGDYAHFYQLSQSELVDIEKVAVCSSL
ncbi:hypothetical protein Tco_0097489 [Tanacetum coccineum]